MTAVERVFWFDRGRVLAAVEGHVGNLDLAEAVSQEAFTIAAERWPRDCEPNHQIAWLVTTTRNAGSVH